MNNFKRDLLSGQNGEDICKFALARYKPELQVIRPNSIKGASSVDLYLLSAGQSEFVGYDIKTDFKWQKYKNAVLEIISQFYRKHCVKAVYKSLFDGYPKSARDQIIFDFINKLVNLSDDQSNLPNIKDFPYEINQLGWAMKDFLKGLLIFCVKGPEDFLGSDIDKSIKKYQKKISDTGQDIDKCQIEKMSELHDELMAEVGIKEYYLLDVNKHGAYKFIRQERNLEVYHTPNGAYYTLGVKVKLESFKEQPFVTKWHWKA